MGSCDCSFSLVSTNSQALVLSYSTRILWTSPLYDSCWLTGPLLVCHTYSALSSSFCLFVHIVVLTLDLFSKFCLSRVVQFSRSRFCHRWLHFHFCPSFGHFFRCYPHFFCCIALLDPFHIFVTLFCSETSGIPCAFWFSHLFSKAHLPFSFLSFVCSFHHFHDFIFHTWNSSDDSWIPFPSLSCLGLNPVSHVCSFNSIPQFFDFCFLCVFCAPRIFFLLVPPHLCISQLFLSSLVSAIVKILKFSGSFSCW